MDLGRVRRKMMRRSCECINAVKMVKVYNRYGEKNGKRLQFKKRWYAVGQLFFFNGTETLY